MNREDPGACTIRERKTKFIDIFRTTPSDTVCPNFYVLAHANGCAFQPQCEYCYLKSSFWYLDRDVAFGNVASLLEEARAWIGFDGLESTVLNTGNLSDSLAFEAVRPMVARLVEVFRQEAEQRNRPHALLLVTKGGSLECAPLFEVAACRNVIVSFSINNPDAAARYEKGAAPVEDRLAAAQRLKKEGWRVRIRIDPMIAGYDYSGVIDAVRGLAPERVTLGTLRAEPGLLRTINHGMFDGLERPSGGNGNGAAKALARYPRDTRLALYRQAVEALQAVSQVGLCEESEEMWVASGLATEGKTCNCGA